MSPEDLEKYTTGSIHSPEPVQPAFRADYPRVECFAPAWQANPPGFFILKIHDLHKRVSTIGPAELLTACRINAQVAFEEGRDKAYVCWARRAKKEQKLTLQ